jgi:hypothetical protein
MNAKHRKTLTNTQCTRTHKANKQTHTHKIGGTVNWDINLPVGVDTVIINVNGTNINFK